MSVLLTERAAALPIEAAAVIKEYERARAAFLAASANLQHVIADLERLIMDGARELEVDAGSCAVRAVIAIHRGDDDAAAVMARATARAILTSEAGFEAVTDR